MNAQTGNRWEALDALRGLSIIGMLLNLNPGTWDHMYDWLEHAKWEGMTAIDMVAPVFLFCIGAAIPLSLQSRTAKGASKTEMLKHIWWRGLVLVLLGLFLNAYPTFDWAHLRIPGVLQRIGISYAVVASFVLLTAKEGQANPKAITIGAGVVLLAYWALLAFVPVPGFGAPRFDPLGSWPSYVDRMVLGVDHMFKWWPVDGKVIFDPDGLVSTIPVCFNVLLGAGVGWAFSQKLRISPLILYVGSGVVLMGVALLISPFCPIIKNIWTPSFALFTSGFSLTCLGLITHLIEELKADAVFFPAKVYGSNALLAYVVSWLIGPLLDLNWIASGKDLISIKYATYRALNPDAHPDLSSFAYSLIIISLIFILLWVCYRKRWFLKL